ncbi:uncharacterized protein LOC116589471 [Mustela erminea]|uniref:uncharacterized protein LOC116589471 n=1 Tax=Mustela erminea TaxID=36723 RepID=UPI0013869111|nr:uncharacterized protein LOC116589471 [Mustela erminea]
MVVCGPGCGGYRAMSTERNLTDPTVAKETPGFLMSLEIQLLDLSASPATSTQRSRFKLAINDPCCLALTCVSGGLLRWAYKASDITFGASSWIRPLQDHQTTGQQGSSGTDQFTLAGGGRESLLPSSKNETHLAPTFSPPKVTIYPFGRTNRECSSSASPSVFLTCSFVSHPLHRCLCRSLPILGVFLFVLTIFLIWELPDQMGQTQSTPLSLLLTNFKDVQARGNNLSLDIRRSKLITFCCSEWPTFGVEWPIGGTICLPIILKIKSQILLPGKEGHPDQGPYILVWQDLVENPPPWLGPFLSAGNFKVLVARPTEPLKPRPLCLSSLIAKIYSVLIHPLTNSLPRELRR